MRMMTISAASTTRSQGPHFDKRENISACTGSSVRVGSFAHHYLFHVWIRQFHLSGVAVSGMVKFIHVELDTFATAVVQARHRCHHRYRHLSEHGKKERRLTILLLSVRLYDSTHV